MNRRSTYAVAGAVCMLITGYMPVARSQQSVARTASNDSAAMKALVELYCVGCHNEKVASGGLRIDSADLSRVPQHAETWEKVIRKLRAGTMPPQGMPRPDRPTLDRFVTYLETSIDSAAANAPPNPGPALVRRLNRSEYAAAVHDLLALDVDPAALLPADDSAHGFDNMADALRFSPVLLEAYLSASRKVSRLAMGDPAIPPGFETYRVRADLGQDQHIDGLPLGTRGGLIVRHNFPLDGEYIFKPKLAVNTSAKVRGLDFPHEFVIVIDGVQVHRAVLGGNADEEAAAINPTDSAKDIHARLEVRIPVTAGPHGIGVTFAKKTSALEDGIMQPFLRTNFDTQEQRGVPVVESLSIGGPFQPSGAGDTPSRRAILTCTPQDGSSEIPCARKILDALATRAFRRPLQTSDTELLLSFYQQGRNTGGFESGIENALRFILASPEFLLRTESADAAPGSVIRVSDTELASRLSFFLWSSIPDAELLDLAIAGKLHEPATLEAQVHRMLIDPRSRALVTNFAAQWLYLRNLAAVSRDLETFPDFDDNLRQGFRRETELFVESIIREDHSIFDFFRADYTYVNERLAKHYGIDGVFGSEFRRVTLPDPNRRGLLGQGSVLTVTSYATRTSPVLRGKWLLENVLGTPVPPPPPDIPALEENHAGAKQRSVRDRLLEHRRNPACAFCHNMMDPLGFSLENFDGIGAWRDRTESREPVDASGTLVDGTPVTGPITLQEAILSRPETFALTFSEKLLTYAIGRGVESYDMPAVRAIVAGATDMDYKFSAIVMGIVNSVPFQMKRIETANTQGN